VLILKELLGVRFTARGSRILDGSDVAKITPALKQMNCTRGSRRFTWAIVYAGNNRSQCEIYSPLCDGVVSPW
jgi:hypothetical protein